MSLSLRPAQVLDIDAVCAIEKHWPSASGWFPRQFADELGNPAARFFVLEEDGAVVGHFVFRIVLDEAQLFAVAVAQERSSRGLGSRLMEESFRIAREASCVKMTLEVREENAAAIALYRKFGFLPVGRRSKYYNDGSDAILMDAPL